MEILTATSRPAAFPAKNGADADPAPLRTLDSSASEPPPAGSAALRGAGPPVPAGERRPGAREEGASPAMAAASYGLGPYRLDARARILLHGGDPVPLGERAVSVLLLLIEQAGRLVRKERLLDIAWNGMAVEESNLTVQIAALRRVLAAVPGGRDWIETLPRRGYRFVGPVAVLPDSAGTSLAALPGHVAARGPAAAPTRAGRSRRPVLLLILATVVALVAVALLSTSGILALEKPAVAVLPFKNLGSGTASDAMAAAVTESLVGGMSRIRNLRTVETRWTSTTVPDGRDLKAIAHDSGARFFVIGTLLPSADPNPDKPGADKPGAGKWEIAARLIDASAGTTEWAGDFTVAAGAAGDPARPLNQLVGLIGDPIATRISALLNPDRENRPAAAEVQSLVNQARQFTEQNARDRSLAAEELFERALALDPDNAVTKVHFARTRISAFVNGWYESAEGRAKMAGAAEMLRAALAARPSYLPALDANCIYMRAVDRFLDGLPACDAVLAVDPWSVRAIKEMGLNQMILGRFEEALASFAKADQLDAFHGMRWTWLEGAGLVSLLLDRNDDAAGWLGRSIEAAPGTGRSFALLAVARERLGRHAEAVAALEKFRERQPGATLRSMFPANRKGNPRYVEAMERLRPALAEAGLPP